MAPKRNSEIFNNVARLTPEIIEKIKKSGEFAAKRVIQEWSKYRHHLNFPNQFTSYSVRTPISCRFSDPKKQFMGARIVALIQYCANF